MFFFWIFFPRILVPAPTKGALPGMVLLFSPPSFAPPVVWCGNTALEVCILPPLRSKNNYTKYQSEFLVHIKIILEGLLRDALSAMRSAASNDQQLVSTCESCRGPPLTNQLTSVATQASSRVSRLSRQVPCQLSLR